MKTLQKITLSCLLLGFNVQAQEEMSVVWQTKLEHKSENADISFDKGILMGSSAREISVLENEKGTVKWHNDFKVIAPGLSKVDEQIAMWEANIVFLFDRKMGKDKMACIDVNTSKLLWMTDKYQDVGEESIVYIAELESFAVTTKDALTMIKARTGEEIWTTSKFKGVVGAYYYSSDYITLLNYKPTELGALFSGFKNQIVKMNAKNGDIVWEQSFFGMAERKVITREKIVDIDIKNGKVFLFLNGIQVYDYNTGTMLWNAAYDYTVNVISKPMGAKRFGVYEAIAKPLVVGNDVYVLDFKTPRKQYIKKYDLNSGKLLWTSPDIDDAKAIPGMYYVDNTVVLQIGGAVEAQAVIVKRDPQTGEQTTTYRVWYPTVKPLGLQAYNATDGSKMWESERFRKDITNAFVSKTNLIVASGKALYSLDIKSGKDNYEVALGDDKIGLATKIVEYKDRVIVVGEKGISNHTLTDGKLMSSGKYKSSSMGGKKDNMLMMMTDNDDIAVFDMDSCKYKEYNNRKGATARMSDDAKYVYVWDKKEVLKLSTK
ncbi:MAG: hypothetical protein RIQ89_2236 [Bacteroidota bacterium]|jgi:outer membrane protein assembly factor BamB